MKTTLGFTLSMFLLYSFPLQADVLYFPVKRNNGDAGFSESTARWYSKSLQRMKEPRLPNYAEDSRLQIFRITILPTWGNPITVRVQKSGSIYLLSARRLNGDGGYDPGKLVEKKDRRLTEQDSHILDSLIASNNIFSMPTDENERALGADGEEWIVEVVSNGMYHVINRWSVSTYETKQRGLEPLFTTCKFLIDQSGLSERPKNLGYDLIPVGGLDSIPEWPVFKTKEGNLLVPYIMLINNTGETLLVESDGKEYREATNMLNQVLWPAKSKSLRVKRASGGSWDYITTFVDVTYIKDVKIYMQIEPDGCIYILRPHELTTTLPQSKLPKQPKEFPWKPKE